MKQYNEAEVLQKAMGTFWKHGYEKTTVRQLESDMGINQFSIYSTFKNKQYLYQKVLGNYQAQIRRDFLKDLEKEDCTLNDVTEFLTNFGLSIAKGEIPNSCLMVKSIMELDHLNADIRKIVIGFFNDTKAHFVRALHNGIKNKILSEDISVEECAEYLIGIAQSVSIYSKIKTPAEIRKFISLSIDMLKKQ